MQAVAGLGVLPPLRPSRRAFASPNANLTNRGRFSKSLVRPHDETKARCNHRSRDQNFARGKLARAPNNPRERTLRMSLRRFTRLTNGHSKSLRHHKAMQSLFVAWYNFGRKHEALKNTTPAMASGLSDHLWSIKEL